MKEFPKPKYSYTLFGGLWRLIVFIICALAILILIGAIAFNIPLP